jgi:light-regulated signal transduction histidine kinase (bacteriophytochrome)
MEWSVRVEFLQRRLIGRQAAELRHTLAELETKNAELDSFVYSVSHDLKAPLVTIEGLAEMLREEYGQRLDDTGRHLLERVEANTRHVDCLIRDLLALSGIGREAQPRQWVDVDALVSRLVEDFTASLRRDVQITRHRLPALWALPTHVEQVFANLVGNAFKYLGDGPDPVIEIGAIDRGETLEFYVRDSGIGIDPEYHAKVFEVFQRLQETKTEGTGVGLAIVKRSVELNGGRIWLESHKGCGATFRFTWPKPAEQQPRDSR